MTNISLNKHPLVVIFFISLAYPILVINTVGLYFDDWEVLANSFFALEYTSVMSYSWAPNVWFLLAPILSKLTYIFNFHVFSLAYFFIIVLNLFITSYCIYNYFENKRKNHFYFTLFLVLFLTFPMVFFASNRSLVIWLCFNASFLYYLSIISNNNIKKYYAILIFTFALFFRFDLVIIFSVILLVFAIFYQKKLIRLGVYFLFISILFFIGFEMYSYFTFNEFYFLERSERIIFDKGLFVNAYIEGNYKNLATYLYINDKKIIDPNVYKRIVDEFSFIKYLFSKDIFKAFSSNLLDFSEKSSKFKFYFLSFLGFIILLKRDLFNLKNLLFFITINLFFLSLLFLFYLPEMFWISVWIMLFIVVVVKNNSSFIIHQNKIVFFLIFCLVAFIYENYNEQKIKETQADKYRDLMTTFETKNINIVYSYLLFDYQNFHSRLFHPSYDNKIDHYYLDAFFFTRYDFVKNKNKSFFNDNYEYLEEKIKICDERKVAFFIEDFYKEFLTNYMLEYHNMSLRFDSIEFINYVELDNKNIKSKPYFLKIED